MTHRDDPYRIPNEIGPVNSGSGKQDNWSGRIALAQSIVPTLPLVGLAAFVVAVGLFLLLSLLGSIGITSGALVFLWVAASIVAAVSCYRWARKGGVRELYANFRAVWTFGPEIAPRDADYARRVILRWDAVCERAGLQEEVRPLGGAVSTLTQWGAGPAAGVLAPKKVSPQLVRVASASKGLEVVIGVPLGVAPGRYIIPDVWEAALGAEVEMGTKPLNDGRTGVTMLLRTAPDLLAGPVPAEIVPMGERPEAGLPVAANEDGQIVSLPPTHTLVIGGTGSGKGSAMWSLVRGYLNAYARREAVFYGIDPKQSEVLMAEGLFCRTAYDAADILDVLKILGSHLDQRRAGTRTRSFTPSAETPWLVLVIDEITSMFATFERKEKAEAEQILKRLLSQGRSYGVVVIGAGQEATKEALGLRDLFPSRIAMRVANTTETGLVLGDDAIEAGAAPHRIPVASPANHYASAGLCYVREETGTLIRARFPFIPDEVLEYWADWADHGHHDPRGCARLIVEQDAMTETTDVPVE